MQTGIGLWVEGVREVVHDCRLDVFFTARGLTPPCKLKPTDPGYEPTV